MESRQESIDGFSSYLTETEQKLDRLMTAYTEAAITLEEFREAKHPLVHTKQLLKDNIAAAEANRGGWFEPAIKFVNATKTASILAESGDDVSRRDFLRKHGSNLTVSNWKLTLIARQPWELVVDQGLFAQRNTVTVRHWLVKTTLIST